MRTCKHKPKVRRVRSKWQFSLALGTLRNQGFKPTQVRRLPIAVCQGHVCWACMAAETQRLNLTARLQLPCCLVRLSGPVRPMFLSANRIDLILLNPSSRTKVLEV